MADRDNTSKRSKRVMSFTDADPSVSPDTLSKASRLPASVSHVVSEHDIERALRKQCGPSKPAARALCELYTSSVWTSIDSYLER